DVDFAAVRTFVPLHDDAKVFWAALRSEPGRRAGVTARRKRLEQGLGFLRGDFSLGQEIEDAASFFFHGTVSPSRISDENPAVRGFDGGPSASGSAQNGVERAECAEKADPRSRLADR